MVLYVLPKEHFAAFLKIIKLIKESECQLFFNPMSELILFLILNSLSKNIERKRRKKKKKEKPNKTRIKIKTKNKGKRKLKVRKKFKNKQKSNKKRKLK